MVYEVNLKLRFLPAFGKAANSDSIRKREYSTNRHKGRKRFARLDNATHKTHKKLSIQKTIKPNKNDKE